ncbi:nephrocystin-3-like [Ptychodera flava]|uniref:nephrocystin-3-like n=1 Tax=Ptychodera flava TaxID=63121 RepID=UPI00396A2C79
MLTEGPLSNDGIDPFGALRMHLAESMITSDAVDDLQRAKTIAKSRIGEREYDMIESAYELFDALEKFGVIRDDSVEYLRLLMKEIGREDLSDYVEEYMKTADVARKQSARPALRDRLFVGREKEKDQILKSLNNETTGAKIVCISGFPGMGKTRLAKEICLMVEQQAHKPIKPYFVELRSLTSIESIFFAIVNKLDGLSAKDYEPNILYDYLQQYDKGYATIVLDSVDKPLEPGSQDAPNVFLAPFLEMLDGFIKINNPLIKFMITTRSGLKHQKFDSHTLVETINLEENDLKVDEAVQILRYHAGRVELSDEEARQLALSCGKCPLALKVVARRLEDPNLGMSVGDMIKSLQEKSKTSRGRTMKTLCHFGLTRDERIDLILEDTFDRLPRDEKRNISMLSVIPGTFTVRAANHILGYKCKELLDVKFDLANLKSRNLIESDDECQGMDSQDLRSNLHLLLRTFIHEIKAEKDDSVRAWCQKGKKKYIRYYLSELREISKQFDKDHSDAMRRKEDDSANFQYLIEMLKDLDGIEEEVEDIRDSELIISLLFSSKERYSYYRKRGEVAKKEGNKRMYAEMRSREVIQLLDMGHRVQTLMPVLNEARFILERLPDFDSREVQLSLATCYQSKGEVYYVRGSYKKAERYLMKSLKIRQIHLGIHRETSRNYGLLAAANLGLAFEDTEHTLPDGSITQSCVFQESKVYIALGYAEQALEMRRYITGSEKQLEVPDIILNIAACYQHLQENDKAIELYKKALDLEKELQISGFEGTQVILKNISMCYFEQRRYEDAMKYAETAMHNRKRLLGVHPSTARSIYFVGSIFLNMKAYDKSRDFLVEALAMEEQLVKEGKAMSSDWRNLKTILPQVCRLLDRERERSQYLRKFQEIEKLRDENIPTIDEKVSSDERFSSSGDEEENDEGPTSTSLEPTVVNDKDGKTPNSSRHVHGRKAQNKTIDNVKALARRASESSSDQSEIIERFDTDSAPLMPTVHVTGRSQHIFRKACCRRLRCCCSCFPFQRLHPLRHDGRADAIPINSSDSD